MVIGIQQSCLLLMQPLLRFGRLALWATAVAATVVMNLIDVSIDANIRVTAHSLCAAVTNCPESLVLIQRQPVSPQIGITMVVQDMLNGYLAHEGNIA